MKIQENKYAFDRPKRRPLKIYASDPMAGKNLGNRVIVTVENEQVKEGPWGERLMVVDYNATTNTYYPALNLDDPNVMMQGGLDPTESDPRFHQQMVYAVAMRTLENFDKALGRRILISRRNRPLRLFPHAFNAANAFYDSQLHAIVFGYFRADASNPGDNLPGQTVFTCLSHDIIAHEVTHAIVHRLRPSLLEPSNVDVLAFHEGFADLVALFQHFSFVDVLKRQIHKTGSNLRKASELLGLAQQFGHATAMGQPLRSGLNREDLRLADNITEPHERGAILVAAVFDAFIRVYEGRTSDLLRLTGGATENLHPDLIQRLSAEASRIAQTMLTMCIRAFDYLPPVDVTFGDFLRAMVTADIELSPEDETGARAALIECFRLRGIYPEGVTSLAEESLVWEPQPDLPLLQWEAGELLALIVEAATQITPSTYGSVSSGGGQDDERLRATSGQYDVDHGDEAAAALSDLSRYVHGYASENAAALMLDPGQKIQARGVHPVFRVAPSGRLVIELVVQIAQQIPTTTGGLPLRGGTTLIVSFDGKVKYGIYKPLPKGAPEGPKRDAAIRRQNRQAAFYEGLAMQEARSAYHPDVMQGLDLASTFRNLHLLR